VRDGERGKRERGMWRDNERKEREEWRVRERKERT